MMSATHPKTSFLLAIDCCLSFLSYEKNRHQHHSGNNGNIDDQRIFISLPVELRYLVKLYLSETITDFNIRSAVLDWYKCGRVYSLLYATTFPETGDCAMKEKEWLLRYGSISYWDTSHVTDMSHLFSFGITRISLLSGRMALGTIDHVGVSTTNNDGKKNRVFDELTNWDTSNVVNMERMFDGCSYFNSSCVTNWNVSNVKNTSYMFKTCIAFNQPINHWQVHNVTNMRGMFLGAEAFNQPLHDWDVSNVTDMSAMFYSASVFNQPLQPFRTTVNRRCSNICATITRYWSEDNDVELMSKGWNVGNVVNMSNMFYSASAFNQPLDKWNTSAVIDMNCMFSLAIEFNGIIDTWDVSNVRDMSLMFNNCVKFNQPLNNWNPCNVIKMTEMFRFAKQFNQSLNNWDMLRVENMEAMFSSARRFNQPLDRWQLMSVRSFQWLFYGAAAFNQPLDTWNVERIEDMKGMFVFASSFNQSLVSWNYHPNVNARDMFE